MKTYFIISILFLMNACATLPTIQISQAFFHDDLFSAPTTLIDAKDIFALSEPMKLFLSKEITPLLSTRDRQHALFDALYAKKQLKLVYDDDSTRNAAQAFEERAGNCLSLVLLTSAFAKALDLRVQYQLVFSNETVSRRKNVIYFSNHINVTLGELKKADRIQREDKPLTIDFIPPKDFSLQRGRIIREKTIVAMYFNNRAAETQAQNQINQSYWFARKAIEEDPTFLSSYNTLGNIYELHGNLNEAKSILRYATEIEPSNFVPLSNLIRVLNRLGRNGEATQLNEKLDRLRTWKPFYFFDLGVKAMTDKDFTTARDMFLKEVDHAAYYHEFHGWLAKAYLELGELELARKHLNIAMTNATTKDDLDLYADRLKLLDLRLKN